MTIKNITVANIVQIELLTIQQVKNMQHETSYVVIKLSTLQRGAGSDYHSGGSGCILICL
jgi:hypothetical protein